MVGFYEYGSLVKELFRFVIRVRILQHLPCVIWSCNNRRSTSVVTPYYANDDTLINVDLDNEAGKVDSLAEEKTVEPEGSETLEPYVGMEFESEDDARKFYVEYAKQVGFVVRIMQRRRSGIDGRTLARRLGCNKQGFSHNHSSTFGPDKKPRPSAREGCRATILVKMEKTGKWVVTRFVKEHNHPLTVTSNGFSTVGDKDKKIEELTTELARQEQLCSAYRENLFTFMNNIEEQTEELYSKVQVIVDNVRELEAGMQRYSHHR